MKKLVKLFKANTFENLNVRTVTGDLCYGIERLPYGKSDYLSNLYYLSILHCIAINFYYTCIYYSCYDKDIMRLENISMKMH